VVARPKTGLSSVLLGRRCLGSRIERRIILEHSEHDHGELARQRHLGLVDAGASGDPHRPAFEFRASLDRLGQYEVGRTNSSWAPCGPRSRSRPSFRMRFKCANRISIFLRSCRDRSKPSVPANDRATSRACSWMSCGILRAGSFGQHCGLSRH
jgi:hypothetical protein